MSIIWLIQALAVCMLASVLMVVSAEYDVEENENGKLIFAQVLYRHGDRTPIDPYPNDPWAKTSFWPTGWGQLTTVGMEQQFELGKWLRNRYHNLLSPKYSLDNIFIQSTDVDRTLMSALANLAGLYAPVAAQVWNPDILWQPIPVHTTPEKMDFVLAAKKSCPAYDFALKKYKNTDEFKKLNKRFKPLYEYLTDKSGRKVDSFTTVNNLYNNLFIEDLKNMTLPEWTKKVFPGGDMQWIAARSFATKTITPQLARLKAGFLLRDILDRFTNKSRSSLSPDRSMWVYSAHDTTVANLLNTLGLFEYHTPPYTACVLMELRMRDGLPVVQVFYKNTTDSPSPLEIPRCGVVCPLAKMYDVYADVLPGEFDEECRLSMLTMTYEEADLGSAMGLVIAGSVLLLLSLICFAIVSVYHRRNDSRWYLRIDSDS